jgi:hypothetical protein
MRNRRAIIGIIVVVVLLALLGSVSAMSGSLLQSIVVGVGLVTVILERAVRLDEEVARTAKERKRGSQRRREVAL